MSFDYEKALWGKGTASLEISSPTYYRLVQSLRAISGLKPGSKVLEVGCGVGQFIRAVKLNRSDLDCFGCDISANAVSEAVKYSDGVSYQLCSDILPYEDACFDAVLVYDVLEHVLDPLKFLLEIKRILKSGGIFYCFVPCEGDFLSMWNLLDKLHLKKGLTKKFAGHINFFSRKSLTEIFINNGFRVSKVVYGELFFGQLAGLFSFYLMNYLSKKKSANQLNNEQVYAQKSPLLDVCAKIGNTVINLESVLLSRVPSPNAHFLLQKV